MTDRPNPTIGHTLDPAELCRFWDEHSARLVLIARSMENTVSHRDAEDAVQEAFLELARQPKAPDDMMGWMVRVVRNRVLDWMRREGRRQKRESAYTEQRQAWFQEPNADTAMDAERLQSTLQSLPEIPRQIIVMHAWGGMTFQQIAVELETSSSTVHRSYQNGIRMMRERLEFATERPR